MERLRIGTRGSKLALWQAEHVADSLRSRNRGLEIEIVVVESDGDLDRSTPIDAAGGTGVFVRQLERSLCDGEVDLLVHSLKDLPSELPEGLRLAAVPLRHDPRDAVLTLDGRALAELAPGARVGTGSPRRRAQLLHLRPDLDVRPIRGNIDTRVRKLQEGGYDALILAVAGIERLALDEEVQYRPVEVCHFLPAAAQGALGLESREDDERVLALAKGIEDPTSRQCVEAERAFVQRVGAGCHAAAAALARPREGSIRVEAQVADADGRVVLTERESGRPETASLIGARLAERLLVAGAESLLDLTDSATDDRP